MGGYHGPMYTGDFVNLVQRNVSKPNVRFIASRWGKVQGAPPDTCTMITGPWHSGSGLNIPIPQIPERQELRDVEFGQDDEGWRPLVRLLIADRTLRPTEELRKLLGNKDFESATRGLGCY